MPELGALRLLDSEAQDVLGARPRDAKRQVHGLIPHHPFIPNFTRKASKITTG